MERHHAATPHHVGHLQIATSYYVLPLQTVTMIPHLLAWPNNGSTNCLEEDIYSSPVTLVLRAVPRGLPEAYEGWDTFADPSSKYWCA